MKVATKEHYKVHSRSKFEERFNIPLEDDDYVELCNICEIEYLVELSDCHGGRYLARRVIKYTKKLRSDRLICCIYDRKNKIIRTLYPFKKAKYKKIKTKNENSLHS